MSKTFPTLTVIGAATGFLLEDGGISEIHRLCEYVAGESVWTHQLPRICREFQQALLSERPELAEVFEYVKANTTRETYQDVAAYVEKRLGLSMQVRPMTQNEHERVDPMSELAEKVHPDRIIPISS